LGIALLVTDRDEAVKTIFPIVKFDFAMALLVELTDQSVEESVLWMIANNFLAVVEPHLFMSIWDDVDFGQSKLNLTIIVA